jgi:hypothetical protein
MKGRRRRGATTPFVLLFVLALASSLAAATATTTIVAPEDVRELLPGDELRGELIRLDEETKWCVPPELTVERRAALPSRSHPANGSRDERNTPPKLNRYRPRGMVPGARYELSVSYPASLPALVDVRLERVVVSGAAAGDEDAAAEAPLSGQPQEDDLLRKKKRRRRSSSLRRRLLDLEKAAFLAGAGGGPALDDGDGDDANTNAKNTLVLIAVRAKRRSPRAPSAGPGPDYLPYNVRLCRAYLPFGALPAAALAPALALAALLAVVVGVGVPRWWVKNGGFEAMLEWVVGGEGGGGSSSKRGSRARAPPAAAKTPNTRARAAAAAAARD